MSAALQTCQNSLEAFRQQAQALTMADPNVAAQRPLSEIVKSTLSAAGSRSLHTIRAYTTGIGYFLQWLETERAGMVPADWGPLATPSVEGRRTVWAFSDCPAAVQWTSPGAVGAWI